MKRFSTLAATVLVCLASTGVAVTKDDVPDLVKQLSDKDAIVRLKAAKTLGTLGADAKDAIAPLAEAAEDSDEDVASAAKRALAKVRTALADSDKDAARSLMIGLLKDVKSNDKETQARAVAGLAKMLKNSDDVIRLQAARGLGDAGIAAKDALKDLEVAAKDSEAVVRKEARKAIDGIETAMSAEVKAQAHEKIAPLIKDLKDKSSAVRQKALDGLGEMGHDANDATETILSLLSDKSADIRRGAMDALEKINPTLQKPVLALLVDASYRNRSAAVSEIGKLGSNAKPAIPMLIRFYSTQATVADPDTRRKHTYSIELLDALYAIDPDCKEFQTLLVGAITAPAFNYRGNVHANAAALSTQLVKSGKLDAAKIVKPITLLLSERESRAEAIACLAEIGPDAKDSLPALRQLKVDPDPATRDAAGEAVKKIE